MKFIFQRIYHGMMSQLDQDPVSALYATSMSIISLIMLGILFGVVGCALFMAGYLYEKQFRMDIVNAVQEKEKIV